MSMVSGLSGTTYEEKLAELGMLTLQERHNQADMVQVYKILQGHDNVEKGQWLSLAGEHGVNTRLGTGVLNLIKLRCISEMHKFFSQ